MKNTPSASRVSLGGPFARSDNLSFLSRESPSVGVRFFRVTGPRLQKTAAGPDRDRLSGAILMESPDAGRSVAGPIVID